MSETDQPTAGTPDGPGRTGPNPGAAAPTDGEVARRVASSAGRWVLDPAASSVTFAVKHFWGAMTVRGRMEAMRGDGQVAPDGTVSGRLVVEAASLSTGNRRRDDHLRSADFFDVDHHPEVLAEVAPFRPGADSPLRVPVTLTIAGHQDRADVPVLVREDTDRSVELTADVVVDRTRFAMTWGPMRMTAHDARVQVRARFSRDQPA